VKRDFHKWNGVSWGNDSVQSGSGAQNFYAVTTDNTGSTVTHFENIAWREVFN